MSLAKRLALSIARLYAYAMAPDDHTAEERREIIDQAGEAIDAANTVVWFEETMKAQEVDLSFSSGFQADRGAEKFAGFLVITDDCEEICQEGLVEAMLAAKHAQPTSQPDVDERNSERKNHDEGTTP